MVERKKKPEENFSAALKAALDAVRNDDRQSFESEIDAYLDVTAPIEGETFYELADDMEQEMLAKFNRAHPLDGPTFH